MVKETSQAWAVNEQCSSEAGNQPPQSDSLGMTARSTIFWLCSHNRAILKLLSFCLICSKSKIRVSIS